MTELKIFIYGVPGSGKTSYSKKLQTELGWNLFEADSLRKNAQENSTIINKPFAFLGTCRAYKEFGELNEKNVIKGLLAVRVELGLLVLDKVKSENKEIMEAAFLDPNQLKNIGRCVLIITSDEEIHKKHFFEHRKDTPETQDEFRATRIVQKFLIEEAGKNGIEIIENN